MTRKPSDFVGHNLTAFAVQDEPTAEDQERE
jgi:hypothetical protein